MIDTNNAGQFRSPEQTAIARVEALLAANEKALEEIGRELPQLYLRRVEGTERAADAEVEARHTTLVAERDKLRLALAAAQQNQDARAAANRFKEDASRQRALAQHLSRLHRCAMKFMAAAQNMNAALVEMMDAARSAYAVLPPKLQLQNSGPLSPGYLARIARATLAVVDMRNPENARLFHHSPWHEDLRLGGGKWATLPEIVLKHTTALREMAERHRVPDPDPATVPEVEPAAEAVEAPEAPPATTTPETAPSEPPAPRKPPPPLNLSINLSSSPMEPTNV